MNDVELINFIRKYVKQDPTNFALMINGQWGIGKSYFIEHVLKEEIDDVDIIIISAYGINSLEKLSKIVSEEISKKTLSEAIEIIENGINNNELNMDFSYGFRPINSEFMDDDDNFIVDKDDFTNKLLIIEDLERCSIDIFEFLGFINNLVDHSNAKIVLVADEEKLLSDLKKESEGSFDKYLSIREKTIRNVLPYRPIIKESIYNIFRKFDNNRYINELMNQRDSINEIVNILEVSPVTNFRSVILGIQTTIDIFEYGDIEMYDSEFFKYCLFSFIVHFIKDRAAENQKKALKFITEKYLLLPFCEKYVTTYRIDRKSFKQGYDDYITQKSNKEDEADLSSVLEIIYSYFERTDVEVIKAIKKLYQYLGRQDYIIPKRSYGRIGSYLINIKCILTQANENLINNCLDLMVKKIGVCDKTLTEQILFSSGISPENSKARKEIELFKNRLVSKKTDMYKFLNFDYTKDDWGEWLENIMKMKEAFIIEKSFFSLLNVHDLYEMINYGSSKQISEIRKAIYYVYNGVDIFGTFSKDLANLKKFVEYLFNALNSRYNDKIKNKQIEYFIDYIEDVISSIDSKYERQLVSHLDIS